jgi:hypothetical protein
VCLSGFPDNLLVDDENYYKSIYLSAVVQMSTTLLLGTINGGPQTFHKAALTRRVCPVYFYCTPACCLASRSWQKQNLHFAFFFYNISLKIRSNNIVNSTLVHRKNYLKRERLKSVLHRRRHGIKKEAALLRQPPN